jgi:hypothetical protein
MRKGYQWVKPSSRCFAYEHQLTALPLGGKGMLIGLEKPYVHVRTMTTVVATETSAVVKKSSEGSWNAQVWASVVHTQLV